MDESADDNDIMICVCWCGGYLARKQTERLLLVVRRRRRRRRRGIGDVSSGGGGDGDAGVG